MLAWQDETHLFEAFDLDGAGQVTWPNWLQRLEEMRALIPPPLPVGPEPSGPLNAIRCRWLTLATPVQHCAARFAPVPSLRVCANSGLRCVACRQGKHVLMVFTSNGVLGESGEQTGWCFPCVLISLVPLL